MRVVLASMSICLLLAITVENVFAGKTPPDTVQELRREFQKRCQEAQEAYESTDYAKAIKVLKQVLQKTPNPMIEYNSACAYAQSVKKEKALYHLEKAVSLGFVNFDYLLKDKNLVSVRESHGFSEIIKKAAEMEAVRNKAVAFVPEPEDILLKAKGVKVGENTPLLIFLHGSGCSPKDIEAALKHFSTDWQYTVFIPCGSVKMGMRDDGKPAYNWAPKKDPSEIMRKIKSLKNIQTDHVYLAGFSAGGFVSYEIGIEFPDAFKGVIVLSGGVNQEMLFDKKVSEASGKIPFYIVHGTQDTMVPIFLGKDAHKYLKEKGFRVVLKKFYGGHSFPSDYINIFKKAIKWFQKNPKLDSGRFRGRFRGRTKISRCEKNKYLRKACV